MEGILRLGRKRKAKHYSSNFIGLLLFLLVAVIIAPLIHEYFHTLVLAFYGCEYNFVLNFTPESGFFATIKTLCALNKEQTILYLGAGVMGNIILSAMFITGGWLTRKENIFLSNLLTYSGFGFLSDPMFYMFANKGDLVNILSLLGCSEKVWILPLIGVLLVIFVFAYVWFHVEYNMKCYYRTLRNFNKIKKFKNEVYEHYLENVKSFGSFGTHEDFYFLEDNLYSRRNKY